MRRVARHASLVSLNWGMLENERPHGIGVALGANRKLAGGRADLPTPLRAVRVVAITALNQSHVHTMAIGRANCAFCAAWQPKQSSVCDFTSMKFTSVDLCGL